MADVEDKIWRHAKRFRSVKSGMHRFPKFLFVPIEEVSTSILGRLSEETKNVISFPFMQDKERVFDVVYDRTSYALGGKAHIEDYDNYLIFREQIS